MNALNFLTVMHPFHCDPSINATNLNTEIFLLGSVNLTLKIFDFA